MFVPATLAAQLPENPPRGEWVPLDLKKILFHFSASRDYENIADYIAFQDDLLPDERIILFFLHAIYDDSLATVNLYARYIVGLLNHVQRSFRAVRAADVDAYMRHFQMNGASPATVNTVGATLKSFFRHLVDSGLLSMNPTAFLKKRRKASSRALPGHLAHSLAEEELEKLFRGMAEAGAPFRDIVLFRLLFMTGLRAEEAVTLNWADLVVWQGQWYLDVMGKGSKARRVYLPDAVRDGLEELRRRTSPRPEQPLFANLRRPDRHITRHGLYYLVKKWSAAAIARTDISPHWFRHSCFTHLAARGASLESIKALAGHESIETTMHYNEAAQLMKPAGMVFNDPKRGTSR